MSKLLGEVMSDISCDCSVDVDCEGRAWCSVVKIRKSRKTHKCEECGDPIVPGQRYEYASGIWDGRPDSHRTCLTCVAIRDRYCPGGYYYGELAQQIEDCLGFDYREVPVGDEEE